MPPAVEVRSPDHWTAREFPETLFLTRGRGRGPFWDRESGRNVFVSIFVFNSLSQPYPKPQSQRWVVAAATAPGRHLKLGEEENLSLWNDKLGKTVPVVKMGRGNSCYTFLSFSSHHCILQVDQSWEV